MYEFVRVDKNGMMIKWCKFIVMLNVEVVVVWDKVWMFFGENEKGWLIIVFSEV